ncbi:hypothetical protein FXW07_15700 [Methanosarcina sp. DH1]|uniref:hypothetical protein n=1 Tax=Methanosarcina sp. DH1 TaxID=2605695 RepID=UPI001E4CB1F2|nr:hypothetical protein [Methanosarcina sp. DH1]MCC4767999.1 hypothetical protein [Methanosarcina sp. DH1]
MHARRSTFLLPRWSYGLQTKYREHFRRCIRDTEIRDTEIRDTEIRDTEIRDIEIRDAEIRDTEIRDTEENRMNYGTA